MSCNLYFVPAATNMHSQEVQLGISHKKFWSFSIIIFILKGFSSLHSYVQAGATAIKLILRNFAPVIKSNMAAPPVSVGVDLVREER